MTGSVHTGAIFVDGLGVGDVGNIVLRDRQHLSEDGIMIVVMTLERHSNVVLAGPDIVSRGFVYVRESEDLMVMPDRLWKLHWIPAWRTISLTGARSKPRSRMPLESICGNGPREIL